jgi:hypothetical protein
LFLLSLLSNKYVLGIIMALGIIGGLYYNGYTDARHRYEEAQQQAEANANLAKVLIAQRDEVHVQTLTQTKVQIQHHYDQIQTQLTTIIERPVYGSECFDADGLRLANDALTNGTTSTPVPPAEVPATHPLK